MMLDRRNRRDNHIIEVLGNNIRRFRKERGLTIHHLANMIDGSANLYSQISRMELGLVNSTVSMISMIAEALGVSPAKLLEEDMTFSNHQSKDIISINEKTKKFDYTIKDSKDGHYDLISNGMKVAKIYPNGFNECDVRWVSLPKIDPKILKKIGEMIEDREL